jgi:hypothetical protein
MPTLAAKSSLYRIYLLLYVSPLCGVVSFSCLTNYDTLSFILFRLSRLRAPCKSNCYARMAKVALARPVSRPSALGS